MVIAVDILDSHLFVDIQSSMNGQTEMVIMIIILNILRILLPKKHAEENQEIYDLTHHGGLVVFLLLLLLLIQHGLIVNLVVIQNTGVRVHHNI